MGLGLGLDTTGIGVNQPSTREPRGGVDFGFGDSSSSSDAVLFTFIFDGSTVGGSDTLSFPAPVPPTPPLAAAISLLLANALFPFALPPALGPPLPPPKPPPNERCCTAGNPVLLLVFDRLG